MKKILAYQYPLRIVWARIARPLQKLLIFIRTSTTPTVVCYSIIIMRVTTETIYVIAGLTRNPILEGWRREIPGQARDDDAVRLSSFRGYSL